MRRRLRKFLPIVMLALAVQILAPIAACWAAGIAASDPLVDLGVAAICHNAGSIEGNQTQPDPTGHQTHDGACAQCCLAHAGAALDAPNTVVAVPYRHPLRVVWQDVTRQLRDTRSGGHAQARAPPSLS